MKEVAMEHSFEIIKKQAPESTLKNRTVPGRIGKLLEPGN
jgi:hypothetical protein